MRKRIRSRRNEGVHFIFPLALFFRAFPRILRNCSVEEHTQSIFGVSGEPTRTNITNGRFADCFCLVCISPSFSGETSLVSHFLCTQKDQLNTITPVRTSIKSEHWKICNNRFEFSSNYFQIVRFFNASRFSIRSVKLWSINLSFD